MITATHRTHWRFKGAAAGVFEGFAGPEQRLLTHHTQATHLLSDLLAVANDPVPANDLSGPLAGVGNAHRIRKNKLLLGRI